MVVELENEFCDAYNQCALIEWFGDMQRPVAKVGDGGNKLRTYACFKHEFTFSTYLSEVSNELHRRLLTKFRLGVCPLRIETGRYEIRNKVKGVPVSERVCPVCNVGVEDEIHFLLVCPRYNQLRVGMFQELGVDVAGFPNVNVLYSELLVDMPKTKALQRCAKRSSIVARFLWSAFAMREEALISS